ncbi:MAG: Flp family type IVb pilin [Firmicutes bacterium]|nr:Flp family type IVb pilin [Bacillota bacterium]
MLKLYKPYLNNFFKWEDGQGMAEYGLILALVAIVVAGSLTGMTEALVDKFGAIATALTGTGGEGGT